jgi:Neuraminidase (sialidase)
MKRVLSVLAFLLLATVVFAAPRGFAPQMRVGFFQGDEWEPAIATDSFGHVYILYPQYEIYPGCDTCPSPTLALVISNDGGNTWLPPKQIAPPGSGQVDAQIAVDPLDGRTVFASWLQNEKSDIAVAKSTDFGVTWQTVIADSTNAGTDKPILLVRGKDLYVGYNHAQKVWVSSSHDGGATWKSVNINQNSHLGWSLAGGGAITPSGAVYFSWSGYTQNGGAKGPVNLYVSKSTDGGSTWSSTVMDVSGAPPDCSAYQCGWAYLGAAITMTSDSSGTLYALWNGGTVDKGPERIYYSTSTDGLQWSAKREVWTAPQGVAHAFPAVASGGPNDIRIAWMDNRRSGMWNVFYRSSTDGGKTWTAEQTVSSYVPGYEYINQNGFSFPFGDYFEMDVDPNGITHVVWGEGLNYQTPGSIWYTKGK